MPQNKKYKFILRHQTFLCSTIISTLLIINVAGYLSAYALTNYRSKNKFSLGYTRPENKKTPADFALSYQKDRITVSQQEWIEAWLIKSSNIQPKGTIILFHGKGSSKSSLLASAQVFHSLGYDSLLVDFRGAGDSSGNVTTVGVKEAQDVALAIAKVEQSRPNLPIVLYGVSMGSAAILRAIAFENIKPDAIILELPFVTLLDAVKRRLKRSNIPSFPLGELIVFWGGVQNGFNGFAHRPLDYAREVDCPALILQGNLDLTVDSVEIEKLAQNIDASTQIVDFNRAGHQLLVTVDQNLWKKSVTSFLKNID